IFKKLNTPDSVYDFRIVAIDSCAANRSPNSIFHSPVQLGGKGQNLSNLLTWKQYQGWDSVHKYYIYQSVGSAWKLIDSVKGTDTSYLHTPLTCGVMQAYQITALDNTGQFLSYSDTVQLTPYDTIKPPAPVIKYATVLNDSQIQLFWHKSIPKVKLYEISMRTGNGSWQVADTVKLDTSFMFNKLNTPDSIYDFRIVAIDSCAANRSPNSIFHSPVNVSGTALDDSVRLDWRGYEGFNSVQKYYIYQLVKGLWSLNDSVPGNITTYKTPTLPCNVAQGYRIGALDSTGQYLSMSDTAYAVPYDTIRPKAPVLYYATVLPAQHVKLSWNWDPKSDVKYFEIWRSTNKGALQLIDTVVYDSVYIDTNLNVKTDIYAYSIIAVDSCNVINRSMPSNTDSLMKINLRTVYCTTEVGIQWSAYKGLGVSAYQIYRSTDGINFTAIGSVNPSAMSYNDMTVTVGTQYYYMVQSVNSPGGYASYSDTLGIVPSNVPLADSAQLVYATVIKSDETHGAILVKWRRDSRADTNSRGYYVYSYNTSNGKYALVEDQPNLDDTTYVNTDINTLQFSYKYYIVTYNLCDVGANSRVHKPILLTIANGDLNAKLVWQNYLGIPVKSYNIYKSTNNGPVYLYANTGTDTSKTDSNIYCGRSYTYQVQAILANGEISFSDSITIKAFDTVRPVTKPIQVATVSQTGITNGQVLLYWSPAIDSNIEGYNIYRSSDGLVWDLIGKSGPKTFRGLLEMVDMGLNTYGQPYYYRIQPFDSCGNIGDYASFHETIHLKVTAQNGYNQINWNAYVGWKIKEYVLTRNGRFLASVGKDTLSFKDTLVYCDSMYNYRIVGIQDTTHQILGLASNTDSARAFDHVPPQKVYLKTVSVSNPNSAVTISWARSASWDTKDYFVYRKYAIDGSMKLVGTTPDTSYTDASEDVSHPDCYYVFAEDHCGNTSDGSNEGCIMILSAKNQAFSNHLEWNGYQSWYDGIKSYNVYKNDDGQGWVMIGTTSDGHIDSFTDNSLNDTTIDFCYQVEAVENPGQYNQLSRSTVQCVHQNATIFIPNSFTPHNLDGLNDRFGPKGLYIKTYT